MIVVKILDMMIFMKGYRYSEMIGSAHDQLVGQEILK